ncbi:MAG: DNA translocase FtsK [Verrucomicrobiota bacterium]
MATNRKKKRVRSTTKKKSAGRKKVRPSEPEEPRRPHEAVTIALLGSGVLFFLALVSYTPADLPTWLPWISESTQPNEAVQNFIGPLGAIFAGYSYFFLGAAIYLVAAVFLWVGIARIIAPISLTRQMAIALVVMALTAACLLHLQPWFLESWARDYNIHRPGGLLGDFFGEYLFARIFGTVGSAIILGLLYLGSLTLVTGFHPVKWLVAVWQHWKERPAKQEEEDASPRRAGGRSAARDQDDEAVRFGGEGAKEKRPRRRRRAARDEAETAQPDLPLPVPRTPPPKIIDASTRKRPAKDGGDPGFGHTAPATGLFPDYKLPSIDLLHLDESGSEVAADKGELLEMQSVIVETLQDFGIEVTPGDITRGPTITRYEVYPSRGLRVNRITSVEADLARATRAERIHILAPIPGKDTVGIEIANNEKVAVHLRELIEDPVFRSPKNKIPIALGKDVYGRTVIGDLAKMPHLLVAGATGSGKSVCLNCIVSSMLMRFTPDELRFLMIDPKVVEMQIYNDLPHLIAPVVTEPKKVLMGLRWVINEMERRYRLFADCGVRNFEGFNKRKKPEPEETEPDPEGESFLGEAAETPPREEDVPDHLPYIVVIIDELADLMQTAPADVETGIARIAQKARAAGIHLIIATQTPRADVVTGIIKANVPARIAFQVASKIDSRVILDAGGADKLVGKGDMLFLPPGTAQLVRAQGALVEDEEVQALVDFASAQGKGKPRNEVDIEAVPEGEGEGGDELSEEDEELIERCLEVILQEKAASTSLLQRRLRLGYTRAARMIDILEQRGIIGPGDGAKRREVLVEMPEEV